MFLFKTLQSTFPGVDRATGFFGCLTPRADAQSSAESRRRFLDTYGAEPLLAMETPSLTVNLGFGPGVTFDSDPTGRVTIVLQGELFLEGCRDAAAVAHRYLEMGKDFARDLNGSFALLVVDRVMDRVMLGTDRIGSQRVLHGIKAGSHWVGSDVGVLPTERFRIDPVGVAWYLANGITHAGRTPYAGIRALPRASLNYVSSSGIESTRYWDVSPSPDGIGAGDREMAEELVRRLMRAVRRQLSDDPVPYLSLSGGWDSASIAGLFADAAGVEDVRCFSYVHGRARPGSDPFVARQLAETLGYEHRMYQSYHGSMVRHIRSNARLGRGTAPPVDEVHAWEALERDVRTVPNPVLFVGDHYLGDNAFRRVYHGRHAPGKMREFHRVRWLAPHLPRGMYQAFVEGVGEDIAGVQEAAGPGRSRGYYFLDQRFPNTLVPWRRQFPGRFMKVRWPLMDYELLDWTEMISQEQRASCIYQRAVEKALPRVFQLPRARTHGYLVDLRNESSSQAHQLRYAAAEVDSRLDEALPPDLAGTLVDLVLREGDLLGKLRRKVSGRVGRAQVTWRKRLGLVPIGTRVARHRVLRNYLILREALARDGVKRSRASR